MHTCTHTTDCAQAHSTITRLSLLNHAGSHTAIRLHAPWAHFVLPHHWAAELAQLLGITRFVARRCGDLA